MACVVVLAGLRMAIQPVGGTAPAPWTTAFAVAFNLYDNPRYLAGSILAVGYALGVPVVATILLPAARRYVNDHRWPLYYLFLCLLSLFGGSDKARLAFAAMPVLLLAMMHGLRGCPVFSGRGLDSLSIFTSPASSGCESLCAAARETEAFFAWTPGIPVPPGLAQSGMYVDPIYF